MSTFGTIVKRFFDILNSLIAILFFLVPWVFISIIIKIQSPGPVLYKAIRVGVNGREFVCLKFRTMKVDSGKIKLTTLKNDDRIFKFGMFLRNTKLDETPQLINILLGQMSVVGPRPEDKNNFSDIYKGKYKEILSVKPGLSSPASIYDFTHGEKYPDEETYRAFFLPKKLELEFYYVKHQSIAYDFKIIIRTIVVIIQVLFRKKNIKEPKEIELINQYEKENVF